jgi:hypothetical protein
VDPARAGGHLIDRGGECRLNESGERRLRADGCRSLTLEGHGLDQAHRQRHLDVAIAAFVTINEVVQEERNIAQLKVAALPQLMGNITRRVSRPAFRDVEGNDAQRVRILAGQKVGDHGLEIGGSGLRPVPQSTQIIFHV